MPNRVRALVTGACLLLTSACLWSQPEASDIRARLMAIHYRQFENFDEYIAKSLQVAALLPSLESFYQQGEMKINQFRGAHIRSPEAVKLADFYASLNAVDRKNFALLKQEVQLSADLEHLPPDDRKSFFDQKIAPLHVKEDVLISEEMRMAVVAKKKGIPLPEDVSKTLPDQ